MAPAVLIGVCPKACGGRGVPSSAGLQSRQGMPARPQVQACSPSNGLSGWFSQTQPQSSHSRHLIKRTGPHRPG
jgi:hypothetical protein